MKAPQSLWLVGKFVYLVVQFVVIEGMFVHVLMAFSVGRRSSKWSICWVKWVLQPIPSWIRIESSKNSKLGFEMIGGFNPSEKLSFPQVGLKIKHNI